MIKVQGGYQAPAGGIKPMAPTTGSGVYKPADAVRHSANTRLAHMEATANTVIGVIVGQLVLFSFGIPTMEAIPITAIIIALSYVRSFVLRLMFRQFERGKSDIGGHVPHGSL